MCATSIWDPFEARSKILVVYTRLPAVRFFGFVFLGFRGTARVISIVLWEGHREPHYTTHTNQETDKSPLSSWSNNDFDRCSCGCVFCLSVPFCCFGLQGNQKESHNCGGHIPICRSSSFLKVYCVCVFGFPFGIFFATAKTPGTNSKKRTSHPALAR